MNCDCKEYGTYCRQLEEFMEALEFYADENNYKSPSTGFALQYEPESSPIEIDKGRRARKLIKELDNE